MDSKTLDQITQHALAVRMMTARLIAIRKNLSDLTGHAPEFASLRESCDDATASGAEFRDALQGIVQAHCEHSFSEVGKCCWRCGFKAAGEAVAA